MAELCIYWTEDRLTAPCQPNVYADFGLGQHPHSYCARLIRTLQAFDKSLPSIASAAIIVENAGISQTAGA